jgi:hypothetical protein
MCLRGIREEWIALTPSHWELRVLSYIALSRALDGGCCGMVVES